MTILSLAHLTARHLHAAFRPSNCIRARARNKPQTVEKRQQPSGALISRFPDSSADRQCWIAYLASTLVKNDYGRYLLRFAKKWVYSNASDVHWNTPVESI
jgi:hypothetical protein